MLLQENKNDIYWKTFFFIAVAVYPYIFLSHMFFPVRLAGFSVYFMAVTIIVWLFFVRQLQRLTTTTKYLVGTACLLYGIFLAMHYLVHDESLRSMNGFRIGITPIVYLVVALIALRYGKTASMIVVVNAVIQAVIGIFHYHFFPELVTDSILVAQHSEAVQSSDGRGYFVAEAGFSTRENGSLINANVYAHMVLLGMMALAFGWREASISKSFFIKSLLMAVMLYGLVLSGSRYPTAVAAVVALYFMGGIFAAYRRNKLILILGIILLVVAVSYVLPEIQNSLYRVITEGMGARASKNSLALGVIFNNIANVIVGSATASYTDLVTDEGMGISDNSILALGLAFGVVYLVLSAMLVGLLLRNEIRLNKINIFMLGYFVATLYLVNAIYWDIYLLYFFITLFAVNSGRQGASHLFNAKVIAQSISAAKS